jgi:hypothetical protein
MRCDKCGSVSFTTWGWMGYTQPLSFDKRDEPISDERKSIPDDDYPEKHVCMNCGHENVSDTCWSAPEPVRAGIEKVRFSVGRRARILAIGAILLFLAFVWPTMYRYEHVEGEALIRINRFTGSAELLGLAGWTPLD